MIFDDMKAVICEAEDAKDDHEIIKKLSEIISRKCDSEQRLCKQVDIYWPISMLQVEFLLSFFFGVFPNQSYA